MVGVFSLSAFHCIWGKCWIQGALPHGCLLSYHFELKDTFKPGFHFHFQPTYNLVHWCEMLVYGIADSATLKMKKNRDTHSFTFTRSGLYLAVYFC